MSLYLKSVLLCQKEGEKRLKKRCNGNKKSWWKCTHVRYMDEFDFLVNERVNSCPTYTSLEQHFPWPLRMCVSVNNMFKFMLNLITIN